jgi:hypothetical protein
MLLPCALFAGTFEGTVTVKITSGSKDGPQTADYSIREGAMRVDIMTSKGGGSFITDFKNKQIIILMPQQQMYMVHDLTDPRVQRPTAASAPAPAARTAPDGTFRDTGTKETIAGYSCEKYEVTNSKGEVSDIWATDQLGMFGGLSMAGGPGRRSQVPPEWENIVKGSGFFPLRVVTFDGGKEKFRMEATAVNKTSLPDSVFRAPDGWRKFDLGSMLGGAFQGGFPGARPSGGNN